MNDYPKLLDVHIQVEPDFSVTYKNPSGIELLLQFTVKHKTAFIYRKNDEKWKLIEATPFIESVNGANIWWEDKANTGYRWVKATEEIQEKYTEFIAEKELLR